MLIGIIAGVLAFVVAVAVLTEPISVFECVCSAREYTCFLCLPSVGVRPTGGVCVVCRLLHGAVRAACVTGTAAVDIQLSVPDHGERIRLIRNHVDVICVPSFSLSLSLSLSHTHIRARARARIQT